MTKMTKMVMANKKFKGKSFYFYIFFKPRDMRLMTMSYLAFFAILGLSPLKSISQNHVEVDSSKVNLIAAAQEIMRASPTCALITLDEEGNPRVRTMDPFMPDSSLTVWFGTNPQSRKVAQIKNDSRVTLYYVEKGNAGYVTLHGKAEMVDEQQEKDTRWKKEWEAFYPDKSSSYTLIKFSPYWMEIVSPGRGILGDRTSWEPPGVILNSRK